MPVLKGACAAQEIGFEWQKPVSVETHGLERWHGQGKGIGFERQKSVRPAQRWAAWWSAPAELGSNGKMAQRRRGTIAACTGWSPTGRMVNKEAPDLAFCQCAARRMLGIRITAILPLLLSKISAYWLSGVMAMKVGIAPTFTRAMTFRVSTSKSTHPRRLLAMSARFIANIST